jgi:protein disulfide-isomerase
MRIFVILAAVILAAVILASVVKARSKPYDESADAKVVLQTALASARIDRKPVFVIFGANWCDDCRALDHAIKEGRNAALIAKSFSVVKVNVGNFDKNLDIVNTYGSPIKQGIPAAIILSPDGQTIYATRPGELAEARQMGETGIYDFLVAVAQRAGIR